MHIHAMGINFIHDKDFFVDRKNGSGDNLLLVFKTPALVIHDGNEITAEKDSAVLYSVGAPQIYGAAGEEYINHWVHFSCDETDTFFGRNGIKFNVPVRLQSVSAVESLLELLSIESASEDGKNSEAADYLLRLLISKAAGTSEKSPKNEHSEALRRLKGEIYSTPSCRYSVNSLAKRLNLSSAHFQQLYKAEFGISVYEDVLRAKTAAAQHYLRSTSLSVQEISELCGYENYVHFIRQFRQRTGMTALNYRRQNRDQ